ncbi:MAG TPA: hypothetical protein VGB75_18410 [Jatrophihabitans sp.]|jgi:hypothetical protein|uniref:hypothetical protein n=1 Tax=Jatrophihabitans sp. TaxID=1932789 RepID=UPI002F128129
MTNPLEDQVYGDPRVDDENAAKNGNPGKPQSDYQFDDAEPEIDPSDFEGSDQPVVPGTVVSTDSEGKSD